MSCKVTTTCIRVTEGQNTINFTLGDTSTYYLVMTVFEKIRVFPIVMSYL